MKVVARVAEIDLHLAFDNHGTAPSVVIVLALQHSVCVSYFPHTAKMIPRIGIFACVRPADPLFALQEKTLLDVCARAVTFLGDRVAGPDKCLYACWAGRRSEADAQPLIGFVGVPLRNFKSQRVCSCRDTG